MFDPRIPQGDELSVAFEVESLGRHQGAPPGRLKPVLELLLGEFEVYQPHNAEELGFGDVVRFGGPLEELVTPE